MNESNDDHEMELSEMALRMAYDPGAKSDSRLHVEALMVSAYAKTLAVLTVRAVLKKFLKNI